MITSNCVDSEKTKSFFDQKEEQYRMPCLLGTLHSIRDISTQYTSNPRENIKDKEDMIQKTKTYLIKSLNKIGYYSECIKLLKKGISNNTRLRAFLDGEQTGDSTDPNAQKPIF